MASVPQIIMAIINKGNLGNTRTPGFITIKWSVVTWMRFWKEK
jgi:hypothetical protein